MALKAYQSADPSTAFSIEGANTNPIRHTFDGRTGGVIETRYYVRNDDNTIQCSNIQVTLSDNEGRDIIHGQDGYVWKLKAGDTQPLDEEWQTINVASGISLGNLTNTTTYLPFWLRVEVPANAAVESFDDVQVLLTCDESLI